MASNLSPDVSATTEQQQKDKEKRFVIITAGKAGVGKSTLLNNFLGLIGNAAFEARSGPCSVTTSVDHCDREINDVGIRVIDMPGFHAADSEERIDKKEDIIGDLKGVTGKGVDVVFYCINLLNRLENVDFENMDTLTKAFGSKIWEHVIFVFTRTDTVSHDGGNPEELVERFIEALRNHLVEKRGVNLEIRSIYSFPTDAEINTFNGIVGIPVSKDPAIPENWRRTLLLQVIRKCRKEIISAILKVNYIDWEDVKDVMATVATDSAHGAAVGSVLGAIVGRVAANRKGGLNATTSAAIGSCIGSGSYGLIAFIKEVTSIIHTRDKIEKRARLKIKEMLERENIVQEASTASQDQP